MTAMHPTGPEAGDTHFFWLYLMIQPDFSGLRKHEIFFSVPCGATLLQPLNAIDLWGRKNKYL